MAQLVDNNVLFCIPDISGFTKFVAQTEIGHSQHIVRELLEGLIDSNNTGLQVSEIEGDAVLFYRLGAPPSLPELVEQARRMFIAFHTLLKRNELYRICQCGACAGANGLTLKIVAHYGAAVQARFAAPGHADLAPHRRADARRVSDAHRSAGPDEVDRRSEEGGAPRRPPQPDRVVALQLGSSFVVTALPRVTAVLLQRPGVLSELRRSADDRARRALGGRGPATRRR